MNNRLTYRCPARAWASTGVSHAYMLREVVEARIAGCWFKEGYSSFDSLDTAKAAFMSLEELQQALQEEQL